MNPATRLAALWTWLFPSPESRAAATQAKVERVVKALAPPVEVPYEIEDAPR